MGAIKPWHLLICLIVVAAIIGGLALTAIRSRRR
jgi:hypothetical protein